MRSEFALVVALTACTAEGGNDKHHLDSSDSSDTDSSDSSHPDTEDTQDTDTSGEGEVEGCDREAGECALWGTVGLSQAVAVITEGTWDHDVGQGVAAAGDVNGDGLADLLIGAEDQEIGGEEDAGAAYLYLSPVVGEHDPAEADARFEGEWSEAHLGKFMSGDADLDGDGLPDLVLIAYASEAAGRLESVAYVSADPLMGSGVVSDSAMAISLPAPNFTDAVVYQSVSLSGDGDGDGYGSLAIGFPYPADREGEGSVFLVEGPVLADVSLDERADAVLTGPEARGGAGYAVDGTGDAGGDGVPDLLITSSLLSEAWLVEGPVSASASLADADTTWTAGAGLLYPQLFGAFAGDTNGDGADEVLLGALGWEAFAGAVMLMSGTTTGMVTTDEALAVLYGDTRGQWFGHSFNGIGDQDGDGFAEVGASGYATEYGLGIYVFYGPVTGTLMSSDRDALIGDGSVQAVGKVVDAGDTNGDGSHDLLTGPLWDGSEVGDQEAAFLFLGGPW